MDKSIVTIVSRFLTHDVDFSQLWHAVVTITYLKR